MIPQEKINKAAEEYENSFNPSNGTEAEDFKQGANWAIKECEDIAIEFALELNKSKAQRLKDSDLWMIEGIPNHKYTIKELFLQFKKEKGYE